MNRSPSALIRYAPSPRAPSDISAPLLFSVVGWYWTISMSMSGAPGPVREGHAVAGADEGVGAGLEDPAEPAGRNDDGLGAHEVHVARSHLHDDRAAALPVLDYEGEDEPLLVHSHVGLHDLLVEDMEEGLPR